MTETTLKNLILITDTYWPANGGVEAWVHAHSAHLASCYNVKVLAHANDSSLKGILSRTVFLKGFSPYSDDAGNRVECLKPSLLGRIALLPFVVWNIPLARSLFAKPLFDFLAYFYKAAFGKQLFRMVQNADIVHCFSTSHLAIAVSDVCKRQNLKFVQSPPVHFQRWGDTPKLLSSYAQANAIICLSRSFKREFEWKRPQDNTKTHVIPALTTHSEGSSPPKTLPSQPYVMFLGRKEAHKGLGYLCQAFYTIRTYASLVICGSGEKMDPICENMYDYGAITEQEKAWLLEHCTVFCVPSLDESFGIVYVEAMRYGKPIVAFDIAPVNELVENGESGFLIDPQDVKSLSKALLKLIADRPLCKEMGKKGKERFDSLFSPSVVLEKTKQIYGSL